MQPLGKDSVSQELSSAMLFGSLVDFSNEVDKQASLAHVVGPAAPAAWLLWGCAISSARLSVNPDPSAGEVYAVDRGNVCLQGLTVDRIGAALGIFWQDAATRRLDDGKQPHFCVCRAVGHYRAFDGSWVQISGEKATDLRDGSPHIRLIRSKEGKQFATVVDRLRDSISQITQDQARLRAMRSTGLRLAYRPEELQQPFFVSRLVFLGQPGESLVSQLTDGDWLQAEMVRRIMSIGPEGPIETPRPMAFGQQTASPKNSVSVQPDDWVPSRSATAQGASQGTPRSSEAGDDARSAPPSPPIGSVAVSDPAPGTCVFGQGIVGWNLFTLSDAQFSWYRSRAQQRVTGSYRERHLAEIEAEFERRKGAPSEESHA